MHCTFAHKKYLAQEIKFYINVFAKNGHNVTVLEKVTKEYMNNITSKNEKQNRDTIKNDKIVKLPCVPKLWPKLGKEFYKLGIKIIFISGRNLKNLICRSKSKLIPYSIQVFISGH